MTLHPLHRADLGIPVRRADARGFARHRRNRHRLRPYRAEPWRGRLRSLDGECPKAARSARHRRIHPQHRRRVRPLHQGLPRLRRPRDHRAGRQEARAGWAGEQGGDGQADRGRRAAGARRDHAARCALVAVQGAGDPAGDAAMVHRDGPAAATKCQGRRQDAARAVPRGDRCDGVHAGARAPAYPRDGGGAAGLADLAPARVGRAADAVRRSRDGRDPEGPGRERAHRRGRRGRAGRMRGSAGRRRASSAMATTRRSTRRSTTFSMCGSIQARRMRSRWKIAG